MSHIIPMVSDSPPPLDDDTWNDDDDDDFGNFASVTDPNIKSPSSDRGLCLEDNVDFGVFKSFNQYNLDRGIGVKEIPPSGNERPVLQTLNLFPEEETHLTNGKPPQEGILSKDNDIEFEQISCDTKTLGYLSNLGSSRGRDSMTDSGHCSTDISPVPKSDESPDSGDKSSSSELEETFNGEIGHKANGQLTSDHCEEEEDDEEEEVSVVKLGDKTGCDKDKTSNSINGSTKELGRDLPPDFSCDSDKEDESCAHNSQTVSVRMDQMSADNGSSPSPPSSPPPPDFPPPARPDTPDMVAEIGADHIEAPDGTTDPYMLASSQEPGTTADDDDWADFSSAPSFDSAPNNINLSNNFQFSLNPSISSTTTITTVTTTTKESSVSPATSIGNLHLQTDFGDHLQEGPSSDKGRQKTLPETAAQVSSGSSLGFNADFSAWDSSNTEDQINDRKIEADFPSQDESLAESSTDYEDMGPDGCDLRSNDSLDESYSISDHVKTVELKYSTEENQESDDDEFGDFGRFTDTGTHLPSEDFVPKTENHTSFERKAHQDDGDEFGDFSEFPCSSVPATVDDDDNDDDDDDDDDWADFATPPQLPTPAAPTLPADSKQESTTSWGDSASEFHTHSTVSFAEESADDDNKDNDDWANFATAVPSPTECAGVSSPFVSYTDPSTSSHKSTHSKVSNAIVPVLNKCFPETKSMLASTESSQLGLLKDLILDEIPLRKSHRSQKTKARGTRSSCCVWKQLLDVDVTDALTYHFTDSKGSNMLFRTLCIDSRKILMGHKKPGVPIFAANLGMLEPSKVTGNDASKSTNLTGSTLSQDTLIDTHRSEPRETLGQTPANPVDMKRMTAASANTLDLDFLVVKDSPETSISKSGVFESELLGGPLKPLPSFKPMQPLEDMLANTKSTTMKQCQPDEHLTSEASKVIQTLPDLSFMHAKVLMFPVRQSSQ